MYHIFILLRKKSENKGFTLLKRIQKSRGYDPQLFKCIVSFTDVSALMLSQFICSPVHLAPSGVVFLASEEVFPLLRNCLNTRFS